MTGLQHPLVQDYLARLDHAASGLPPEIRVELVSDLSAHLDSALGATSTDADVRNTLQELGAPEDVVAAAYDGLGSMPPVPQTGPTTTPLAAPVIPMADPGGAAALPAPPPASPWGPVEIIAVVGLTGGTFLVPFVGPLVGLVMAWVSDKWSRREKLVATVLCLAPVLVLAVGLIALLAVSGTSSSGSGSSPVPAVEPTVQTAPVGGTP